MEEIQEQNDLYLRAQASLMECLRDLRDDRSVEHSGEKLTVKEKFNFANISSHFLQVKKSTVKQGLDKTAQSIKAATEAALPIFIKAYGEAAIIKSLSFIVIDQDSINLFRQHGATAAADLCQTARDQRTAQIQANRASWEALHENSGGKISLGKIREQLVKVRENRHVPKHRA